MPPSRQLDPKQLQTAYRNAFGTRDGAIVLADLRENFYDSDMTNGPVERLQERAGAQGVVRYVLDYVED